LFGRGFVLLAGAAGDPWTAAAAESGVTAYRISDPRWHEAYGVTPGGAVLVRPDGYVAWRSPSGREDAHRELERVLDRILDRRGGGMRRREVIRYGALGAASVLFVRERPPSVPARPAAAPSVPAFSVPLAIPPVARPVRRTPTTDYYTITTREAEAEIFPGVMTKILAYDGLLPGPTIRAWSGREVRVTHVNALPAVPAGDGDPMGGDQAGDIAVHLHGGHVATADDGHPKDPIPPGGSRVYHYPNRQEAATLWYHDHAHHVEAEHVFRGLAACYLIGDQAEARLGLPAGRHDVPLMLRDARFDDAGQLLFEMDDFRYRQTILVNGRPQPYLRVEGRRYRFRVINASNERTFTLRLSSGAPMLMIASDGGLLPAPIPATSVTLSSGERVELVVDFAGHPPGTQIVLENTAGEVDSTRAVMRFDVTGGARDPSRQPRRLRPALPDLGDPVVTRKVVMTLNLQLGRWEMDGRPFDMDRVDQHVAFGDTEIWEVANPGLAPAVPHNIHLHGVHFQVLDRDGTPVSGHETGWKDTVYIPAGSTVRFKVRFDTYRGRYLYHCHLLDHSSMGMMAQMEIA
jgi:FtsP/CotA-like multicopper oxidase with cupredoxin domain